MNSLPYILLFILLGLTSIIEHKTSGRQLVLVRVLIIIVLLFFFGLRGFIGTDFINYYGLFKNIEYELGNFTNLNYSIGFLWLTYYIKSLWANYHFYVFILTLIHFLPLSIFLLKHTKSISLAMIFFLGYRGLIFEFNLLQNSLSLLFFVLSVPFLKEKKYSKFILLNIIGSLFHFSSLLFIPLSFFLSKKFKLRTYLLLILLGNLVYFLKSDLIVVFIQRAIEQFSQLDVQQYTDYFYDDKSAKFTVGYLERLVTILIILMNKKIIEEKIPAGTIFINMAVIFNLVMLLFSSVYVIYDRLSLLFILSFWVLLPNIVLNPRIKKRTIYGIVTISLCLLKLITATSIDVMRYDNITTGIDSYTDRFNDVQNHNYNFRKQ